MLKVLFSFIKIYGLFILLAEKVRVSSVFPFIYRWHHLMIKCYLQKVLSPVIKKQIFMKLRVQKKIYHNCYIFWYQGFNNAPEIVRKCVTMIKKTNPDLSFHFITKDTLDNYTEDMPDFIKSKFYSGIISVQCFSDILRSYLLYKNGGFWCDATLFVTQRFKDEIYNYSFYSIKSNTYNPKNVSKRRWTAYFLYSTKDCIIMKLIYDAFCSYYSSNNKLVDYFLIDHIINLGYDMVPFIRNLIDCVPNNNEGVWSYMDSEEFSRYKDATYIYKLNWREKNIGCLENI